jgi:GNAT superfamily N-acetyltransferase
MPQAVTITPLDGSGGRWLEEARAVLRQAHPHDEITDAVADEKLVGENAGRVGRTWVATNADRAVVGVAAAAGRWLKLLAVSAPHRRRGIGSALLAQAQAFARRGGAAVLRAMDHPGNYLTPGVDERATEGLAFLRARGFRDAGEAENLDVPLTANPAVSQARAEALALTVGAKGYVLRRGAEGDREALVRLAREAFSNAWSYELARALGNDPPGVHLALDDGGAVVAFAAHDGNNRGLGWFGPAGTLPDHRGRGLGEVLLLRCLLDIVRSGRTSATIAWSGAHAFYQRVCGARRGRRFLQLERAL